MLDIKFIRENPDLVQEKIHQKGADNVDIQTIIQVDNEYRTLLQEVESIRSNRNRAASEQDIESGRVAKMMLTEAEEKLRQKEKIRKELLISVPNLPFDHLPIGGEEVNKVIKQVGTPKKFDFEPRDHVEIGQILDIIDIPRAAKVSGSRFAYLKNDGVMLELALIQYAMKVLQAHGFAPIFPPVLIKQQVTEGLGYWQKGGNENYYLVQDKEEISHSEVKENPLYLIGTAEHALVPMHQDETFQANELSKKYAGFSPAFRREAGTYGKDTKGILRVHQFDKVEMVVFCKPEDDDKERAAMLATAERLVSDLGLAYQTVQLATGDISFPAAETIDIETWIPSQKKYRETHSISTCTDFQARRLNIKYQDGAERKYVHILNGTAYAIGRMIIAILENYQQADGSVLIPEVLQAYMGKEKITKR